MTLDIRLATFSTEDESGTKAVINALMPMMHQYWVLQGKPAEEFNPDIEGLIRDWWHNRVKIVVAFNDNKPSGFVLCYVHSDVMTSKSTFQVTHCLATDATTARNLKQFAYATAQALHIDFFDAGS